MGGRKEGENGEEGGVKKERTIQEKKRMNTSEGDRRKNKFKSRENGIK